jgi:hypothetical protein
VAARSCSGAQGRTGTLYTYAQLEGLWINAGGSKALAPTMAAIAEAESGGCSAAYNPSGATGLWQILGAVNPADQNNLYSPQVNAREAVLKYQTQGLNAWATYQSGAYKAFMNGRSTPDLSGIGSGLGSGSGSGSSQTTSGVSGGSAACLAGWSGVSVPLFGSVGSFCLLTKTEARAFIGTGILLAGSTVMFVGLAVLTVSAFSKTRAGQAAGRAVGTAGEIAGGALALAGAPEAGAAVTAAGHGARSAAGHAQRAGQRRKTTRTQAAERQQREEVAQENHTAAQYRRQRRARENYDREADLEPAPF